MSNSINTNISALYAQANITTASNASAANVARLSSGNRIVEVSDDVAAFATGTSLATQVSALTTAQSNVSQGSSLLQVADGGLAQIQSILQQQQAIALQAASGSLTDTDRGFLNQEFQALSSEINSLASSTQFNGLNLIDGSLSQAAGVTSSASQATAANATLSITNANLASGDTIKINGVTLTAVTSDPAITNSTTASFLIGATAADTISNLKNTLNNAASGVAALTLGQASYSSQGNTLTITSNTGGTLGNNFTIDTSGVSGDNASVGGSYGGSTINLFQQDYGFASSTTSVVGDTSSSSEPFQAGDNLSVQIGSSAPTDLYTFSSGDSLQDIVNGINANSASTDVSAELVYGSNGHSGDEYNIQLNLSNSSGDVSINGGANFYNVDNSGNQYHQLSGATSTVNLLTTSAAAAISTAGGILVADSTGDSSATSPFVNGSNIYVTVAGGAREAILDNGTDDTSNNLLATGDTIADIITKINTSEAANNLGIHATSTDSGKNIAITFADPTQSGAISFESSTDGSTTDNVYNTDALGQTATNALNGSRVTFNLLPTGVIAPNTSIVAASGDATAELPLTAATTVTLKIGTSASTDKTVTLTTPFTQGDTLQDVAGDINTNATAIANGIHASVVQDSSGKYNVQLSYSASAAPVVDTTHSLTTGLQVNFNSGQSNYSTTNNVTPTFSTAASATNSTYQLFNTAYASQLSAGQVVVADGTGTTAALPFSSSDSIVVNVGGSVGAKTIVTSAQLATGGQTLADLVGLINDNSSTTKISAALDGNGTNILLSYTGTAATNPSFSYNLGTHFYDDTDVSSGVVNVTNGAANSYATTNLWSANVTPTSYVADGASVISTASTSAGSTSTGTPFGDGNTLIIKNGSTAVSGTINIGASETVQGLVNAINTDATAQANGVHAQLIDTGSKINIAIYMADQTGAGSSGFTDLNAVAAVGTNTAASSAGAPNTTNLADGSSTFAMTYHAVNNQLQNVNTVSASTVGTGVTATPLDVFGLAGGENNGLGYGSTTVTGTVGDSLVTDLSQNAAQVSISFPDIDSSALDTSSNFGSDATISVGGHTFTYVTSVTAADQILIGSTLQQTLDNTVSTINSYGKNDATGDTAYQLNQITASRNGNTLVFTGAGISDVTNINGGAASQITTTVASASNASNDGYLDNSSRDGTSTFGIDVSGISNSAFTGTISGATATYAGTSNTVDLSVKVGNYTYTANNVNTDPITGNETVRFTSNTLSDGTNGGYFDLQLADNNGQAVNSQSDANTYGTRVNAALSGLNFSQNRQISSYSGTEAIISGGTQIGSLIGSSMSAQLSNFNDTKLTNISVTAPPTSGGDAKISLTINGEQFDLASGVGNILGANQTYQLTSTTNPNDFVDFTTGNSAIDISTAANATAVQNALSQAFGVSNGAGALSFQIGSSSTDTLNISIGGATTNDLFNGASLDVSTQSDASTASDALTTALNTVTSLRSTVGAAESQFNFASAALQSSVQNQSAAQGSLLDTDIASESTAYATNQVKLQAGISVLAQANQQLQALLKLIG